MIDPSAPLPLDGIVVLDATRMLPGAVLVRMLLDLGARVIKIEDPRAGDMMRWTPPLRGGLGVGFAVYFRGAESVALDLRHADGAAALRQLIRGADLLLESFRPGTLDAWGLGLADLRAAHPRLITCSIPGYADSDEVGHDLNFTAQSGLLGRVRAAQIPSVQLADVTAGTLACTAILAALFARARSGHGQQITQPLAQAPLHFLTWAWAEAESGGESMTQRLLGGDAASYRTYRCGDGRELAVGCLEPKFWVTFVNLVGLPELAADGLDLGPAGERAAARLAERLAAAPRAHWLDLIAGHNLPITPVHPLSDALLDPRVTAAAALERTPMADGGALAVPGPSLPSVSRTPQRPAPRLGEHTRAALLAAGAPEELITRLGA